MHRMRLRKGDFVQLKKTGQWVTIHACSEEGYVVAFPDNKFVRGFSAKEFRNV